VAPVDAGEQNVNADFVLTVRPAIAPRVHSVAFGDDKCVSKLNLPVGIRAGVAACSDRVQVPSVLREIVAWSQGWEYCTVSYRR
jgi:hypothetical protein